MNEINLLHDSRGRFHYLSRGLKIILFTSIFFFIATFGISAGIFLGKALWEKPTTVAAEAVITPQPFPSPTPTLTSTPPLPSIEQFQQTEKEIEKISQTPIKLIYKTKMETIEEIFASDKIKTLLGTSIWGNQVLVVIHNQNLDQTVFDSAQKIDRKNKIALPEITYEGEDRNLDQLKLKQILRDELFNRSNEQTPRVEFDITNLVEEKAGSNGSLAEKYLEVDLSQQKLYRWEGGKVVGKHIISTGKYGPTPIGVHKIKNKFPNAWSPPAQCWTPFWMAYAYNPDLKAYLGFHELPYWEGPNGTKIRRPLDTLGAPVTGGCIQLNIGDAEEVYNWAEVGIPVLIHE